MSDSVHVGPVIFADGTARDQLVNKGYVVTFRSSERTTGHTWWRKSRTGPKEGDCAIRHLWPVDPSDAENLEPMAHMSGFDNAEDWQEAIKELNGNLSDGHLYRVLASDSE